MHVDDGSGSGSGSGGSGTGSGSGNGHSRRLRRSRRSEGNASVGRERALYWQGLLGGADASSGGE